MINDFSVVDMFCGVGGLSHGFVKEGFKVVAGVDLDSSCSYAYQSNNHAAFYHCDISELKGEDINKMFLKGTKKILVGCAPCQDFSIYNQKNKSKSGKWKLVYEFARIIKEVEPDIISMENVPQLKSYNNGNVLKDFIDEIQDKYNISYNIVNAQDYGVPQRRKRLILIACKKEKGIINLIAPTHGKNYKTVADAIGHLEKIEDGQVHHKDRLHRARKLTEINKKRIKATKEGGFWRDWSEDLRLECHKTESGKEFRSVYGRMKWNEVAPTLTTYCIGINHGRFGHPEQDRGISLREAALLQSFPENYEFVNPENEVLMMTVARHIGNAVPVDLARAIAKSIKFHIENTDYGK